MATAEVPSLEVGAVLAGRYRIEALAGRGGMGVVWRAFDLELEEPVAVKMLEAASGLDDEAVALFKQEIRLARKIVHRNVCRIHDFGTDGVRKFVTMELIEGDPLDRRIREGRAGELAEKLEIFRDILLGVRAAHLAGIVHQDLKPANVMIDAAHRTVVMDFGIARLAGAGDNAATFVGTPRYMAPERFLGRAADPRSDLYSLGVLLFELVTGRLPFEAGDLVSLARAHTQLAPPVPSRIVPGIPRLLDEVVRSLLAKRPEDRHQRVDEVLEELADIGDEEVPARVLIAEDDPVFARLVATALEREGIEVTTVSDGDEAVEQWLRKRPDLLCLDYRLPRMDGFRVVEYLRSTRRGRGMPVFLFSGVKDPQYEAWAHHLGIEKFFRKPFSVRDFARQVCERIDAA